ncbi:hypothetical protein F4805DRAFT_463601 [Annulohypoxylon moriforme]|nr:hypothetical protein F4805DRAFT_463601 [Annulohypoxylon moriforme]
MASATQLRQNANGERNKLPGFGLPFKDLPDEKDCFLDPFWKDLESIRLSPHEIRMMDFMNQVTDNPNWEELVFDNSIVDNWQKETSSTPSKTLNRNAFKYVFLTKNMFNYCIEELRFKAKQAKETGIVDVLDANMAVAKSDTIIPSSLTRAFQASVKSLENAPKANKDWRPKFNKTILDVVSPSLYPVTYGITRVLPYGNVPLHNCASFAGEGEITIPFYRGVHTSDHARWGSHQMLPSDIKWSENGLKIVSYINNLHPKDYSDLYKLLEEFVAAAVPLWEECVAFVPFRCPRIDEESMDNVKDCVPEGIKFTIPDEYIEFTTSDGRHFYDEEYKQSEEYLHWLDKHEIYGIAEPRIGIGCKRIVPKESKGSKGRKVDLKTRFPDGIQVIFKLVNIRLNPEKPQFTGGDWRVEGALNDRIVATAVYDYDARNITSSRIAFRQLSHINDEEDEIRSLEEIGSVLTRPGRMVAFPNVFQHQAKSFRLRDPTKPGYRKFLAMFLVDPNTRVLSTGVVPPQQKDWWAREVRLIAPFSKLPMEVFEMIINFVEGYPMSLEGAKVVRENLIRERISINQDWEDFRVESEEPYDPFW